MENKKYFNKILWVYPAVILISQILPIQIMFPVGIIFTALGIIKIFRMLLLFGFSIFGHILWLVIFKYLHENIQNETLLIIFGRFGLLGYIVFFAFWIFFQPNKNKYLKFGNIKAEIKFPLVWWGFKEYIWRFILIFCILCSIASVVIYMGFNGNPIILYGLLFALVNSILEGVLWRGFILGRIVDFLDEKQALIITSLAFGFYHISLGFPIWTCLVFSIGGFYFGGVTIKSKGIFASIIMHFFVNMVFVFSGIIF